MWNDCRLKELLSCGNSVCVICNKVLVIHTAFFYLITKVRTTLKAKDLPENLKQIRLAIESEIPHGRSDDGGRDDVGSWRSSPPQRVIDVWKTELLPGYRKIIERSPDLVRNDNVNHINHLGTLGTGNHFLEVSLDEEDRVWLMLHSGSRGVRCLSLSFCLSL
jgi:RNA-splicing ligase RtcB